MVADTPRHCLRTRDPSRVHLSSKNRIPLTSRPVPGARESRISRRLPFRLQIRESYVVRLKFCKMSNGKRMAANRENRTEHLEEAIGK